jgi:RND family efflux transporter MFP subunit
MIKSILFSLSTGILMLASCSSKEKKEDNASKTDTAISVTVMTASAKDGNTLHISGQIEAAQSVNISTRLMGYITFLKVKAGDHVNKGQLLVSISDQDIQAKKAQTDAMISEADAAVKNAKKDLDRFSNLYKQQSATAKELDNVTMQYNAANDHLEAAKQMRNEVNAQLNYSNLYAPFSGIVTQKMAEAGSMASPGMPILTIEQAGAYQVSASVPETMISQIQVGNHADLSIKAIDKSLNGTVSQINQSSQFTGGQYIIKVQIADNEQKGLYAGMYTDVNIPMKNKATSTATDNTILVPASVIEYKNQLAGLYTISSNHTALIRWVRLGRTYGDKVEVLSGLEKSEPFIASANGKLYNGAPVTIK